MFCNALDAGLDDAALACTIQNAEMAKFAIAAYVKPRLHRNARATPTVPPAKYAWAEAAVLVPTAASATAAWFVTAAYVKRPLHRATAHWAEAAPPPTIAKRG